MASDVPPPPPQMGWLETQFLNLNIVIWIIIAVCCSPVGTIVGLIGYFTSTNPKAKQNALITLIIGAIVWLMLGGGSCFSFRGSVQH
jgi:hypothetical protein